MTYFKHPSITHGGRERERGRWRERKRRERGKGRGGRGEGEGDREREREIETDSLLAADISVTVELTPATRETTLYIIISSFKCVTKRNVTIISILCYYY